MATQTHHQDRSPAASMAPRTASARPRPAPHEAVRDRALADAARARDDAVRAAGRGQRELSRAHELIAMRYADAADVVEWLRQQSQAQRFGGGPGRA